MTLSRPARRIASASRIWLVLASLACSLDHLKITESGTSTVDGGPALALLPNLGFSSLENIDVSQNQTFKSKGADINDISSAKLDSLMLTITDPPSGQDFSFIQSIKFYAATPDLPKTLIASGGPFQAGLTEVGLDVEDVELKPFVASKTLQITSEVNGHPPAQTTTIKATVVLDVDVNVGHVLCGHL